jgi:hypothetical protein
LFAPFFLSFLFVKLPMSIFSRLSFEVKEIGAKSVRRPGGVIAGSDCLLKLYAINHLDSAHKSRGAWVRIASGVQAWIVVHRENPQRLGPIRISAHLIPINAPPAKTARWKRCVPRLAIINVWISKGFYLHTLQLYGKAWRSSFY